MLFILSNPLCSELYEYIHSQYSIVNVQYLGEFTNIRKQYKWNGHKVMLDETHYPSGVRYELEIHTNDIGKEIYDDIQEKL